MQLIHTVRIRSLLIIANIVGYTGISANLHGISPGTRPEENPVLQSKSTQPAPKVEIESKYYFYSFTRSNPKDPAAMQQFGSEQSSMVSEAVKNLPGLHFSMDVESNPLKVRIVDIKAKLANLREKVGAQDTVVIYTHSHGLIPGLGIDWETSDRMLIPYGWEDYAEAIVSIPAKNVIVFTMACHSGYLTAAMQKISHKWQGLRKSNGRSLIVLTAVSTEQKSKATDINLKTGIGNPFNYAVRTALKGAADSSVDGNKDGRTSFEEMVKYILKTAKEKSTNQYAEPQFAGEYVPDANLF
jgi:hypothetical protein